MVSSSVRFRPRALPWAVAVLMIALTCYLGHWQQSRAAEKLARQQVFDERARLPVWPLDDSARNPEDLRYRRVSADGVYLPGGQILLDNQFHGEEPGYHVLTPMRLGRRVVLVNRGFLSRGPRYPAPPDTPPPAGAVHVEGVAVVPTRRFLELSADVIDGTVWQNLKLDVYAQRLGLDVLPVVILQTNAAGRPLPPVTEVPDTGVAMHRGYAFQWYAMAAVIAFIAVFMSIRRDPQSPTQR